MKKKDWDIHRYEHAPGDYRLEVTAGENDCVVLYVTGNGSGLQTCHLSAGQSWPAGQEQLKGVYHTEEEAWAAWDAE